LKTAHGGSGAGLSSAGFGIYTAEGGGADVSGHLGCVGEQRRNVTTSPASALGHEMAELHLLGGKIVFDKVKLQAYLDKWQSILRLRDWDIKLELVTKEWRKSGDVKIDQADKTAILLVNTFNSRQTNIEALIIHELLHIKLWGMDQMIENLLHCVYGDDENDPKFSFAYTQFMELLEVTTEDLAKGYVELGADDKSVSFGRIQPEADKEWGKNRPLA